MSETNIQYLLKTRRKELGLTMKEVAKAVGVSEATVSRWESGNIANMGRDKIYALSKVLEISPAEIMGIGNTNNTNNEDEDEKIAILNRNAKKLTPEQRQQLIDMAKVLFREDWND